MLDIGEQKIGIYDYQAKHVGFLNISLVPCDSDGVDNPDELSVEEPIDLVKCLNILVFEANFCYS